MYSIKFRGGGYNECIGVDGDYVDAEYLTIPKKNFYVANLESNLPSFGKRFDLAISLEVAEHLEPTRANGFVGDLCAYSDVILFSAATILQGGNGHKNEQRLSYWVNIFKKYGYECFDVIRKAICNDTKIPDWYRNNVVIFAKSGCLNIKCDTQVLDYVVPDMYERKVRELIDINKRYEDLIERCEKVEFVKAFFEKLAEIENKSAFFLEIMSKLGYKRIALYGFGKVGTIIWNCLKKSNDVEIVYVIDHYLKESSEIQVFDYTDNLPRVDAIIVTPLLHIDSIKEILNKKVDSDVDIIGVNNLLGLDKT